MPGDPALERARYAAMRFNAPLSPARAAGLLAPMRPPAGGTLLDLGCGWGELLLEAVAQAPAQCRATGVDTDPELLSRAEHLARERGLLGRVRFVCADASSWSETADRLLCIGAAHAWGGTAAALAGLQAVAAPGARLLYGDGCWPSPPSAAAAGIFGQEIRPLDEIVALARDAGWRVLHQETADLEEWDAFEAAWRAGREVWCDEHPDHPEALGVRAMLDARREEYERDYRGVLGFCYLLLATG